MYAEERGGEAQRRETPRAPWDGTVHFGTLSLDPEIRLEGDWHRAEPSPGKATRADLALSGRRVGVEGRVGQRLGFNVSAELSSSSPWRNILADYRLPAGITLTGGQFKVPFSLDGTLNAVDRDFVFRSRLGDAFTMGRDRGITAEARLWRKRLTVEGGLFARDGDRVASDARVTGGARRTRVARVTTTPLARGRGVFRDLRVGLSASSSLLDESRSGLTLRTVAGQELTSPVYWTEGARRRAGIDIRWRPGPFSLTAEYLAVTDERRGQGTGDDDLPPLTGAGWYVEGTWLLTGELKAKALRPRRPLQRGGALELVGRAERASLGDNTSSTLEGNPRAARPASSAVRVLTTGLNWYPRAGARLQFNVTHETVAGATITPLQGMSTVLTSAVRFQIFL
jgi:phosphate-selective porin